MKIDNFKFFYVILISVLFFQLSCSDNDSEPISKETYIVSQIKIGTITKAELEFVIFISGVVVTPVYDVDVYKIEYHSTSKKNAPIICSGIICIPVGNANKKGIISCQHYTLLRNYESPSQNTFRSIETTMEAVIVASLGYISVSNDYLGFGSTANKNIPQSYHIDSYTSADWLSFMKAVDEFINNNSISTNNELRIIGYSQGGYNVTAAMKKWETENHNFFNLIEVYSGAGAYSLTKLVDEIFSNNDYYPIYLMHPFITAYNYYYDLNLNYGDIYKAEYRNIIDNLYDVNSSQAVEIIINTIPNKLDELFEEKFINEMKNRNGIFYSKLSENNITNFAPRNKLYMFHSNDDEYIPVAIADETFDYYISVGGNVELIKSSNSTLHSDTYIEFMNFVLNKLK